MATLLSRIRHFPRPSSSPARNSPPSSTSTGARWRPANGATTPSTSAARRRCSPCFAARARFPSIASRRTRGWRAGRAPTASSPPPASSSSAVTSSAACWGSWKRTSASPPFDALIGGRRIVDAHQIETARRSDGAAGGAVAGLERGREIVGAPLALADELERAHHRAHLVVQERARRGGDVDLLAAGRDLQAVERLDRRFGLAAGGAKGGEVVPAGQRRRSVPHRLHMHRLRH